MARAEPTASSKIRRMYFDLRPYPGQEPLRSGESTIHFINVHSDSDSGLPPPVQAVWYLKCRALTLKNWIDDTEIEEEVCQ